LVAKVSVVPCCTPSPLNTFALRVFVADINKFTKLPPTKPMLFDTWVALASTCVVAVVIAFAASVAPVYVYTSAIGLVVIDLALTVATFDDCNVGFSKKVVAPIDTFVGLGQPILAPY
jgi:hypothetical protein